MDRRTENHCCETVQPDTEHCRLRGHHALVQLPNGHKFSLMMRKHFNMFPWITVSPEGSQAQGSQLDIVLAPRVPENTGRARSGVARRGQSRVNGLYLGNNEPRSSGAFLANFSEFSQISFVTGKMKHQKAPNFAFSPINGLTQVSATFERENCLR